MDELGLKRYCCRRMIMTHVDLIEKLLKYAAALSRVSAAITCTQLTNPYQVHPGRSQREEAKVERRVIWDGTFCRRHRAM